MVASLTKGPGRHGYLLFCLVDERGNPVEPVGQDFGELVRKRLAFWRNLWHRNAQRGGASPDRPLRGAIRSSCSSRADLSSRPPSRIRPGPFFTRCSRRSDGTARALRYGIMKRIRTYFQSFTRRDWLHIAGCMPAVLCVMFFFSFAFTIAVGGGVSDQFAARYAEEAHRQFEAKNYVSACVCLERLAQLQPDRPEVAYGLAMALDAVGESGRVASILRSLAPSDRRGFAPAHLWQAKLELRGLKSSPHELASAEKHLLLVTQAEPENHEANAVLGELYHRTGRWPQAEPYLRKAARYRPELLVLLAKMAGSRGSRPEVRGHAEAARTIFRKRAEARPLDREARGYWAAAALLLEDYSGDSRDPEARASPWRRPFLPSGACQGLCHPVGCPGQGLQGQPR